MMRHGRLSLCPHPRVQEVLTGSSYESIVDQLAQRTLAAASHSGRSHRYVVGIAGAPGSGKSTTASLACDRINKLAGEEVAVILPMVSGAHDQSVPTRVCKHMPAL